MSACEMIPTSGKSENTMMERRKRINFYGLSTNVYER